MENKFIVSSSPHIRSNEDTSYIMKQVILALVPVAIAAVYYFRISALFVMFFCILGTVGSEFLYQKLTKQKSTIGDCSAIVTGLLLAFNVPASLPWWMCILGGVFAIIVVKMLFGGLGNNFVNPALAGRAFLLASFPVAMTAWTKTGLAAGLAPLKESGVSLMDMALGNIGGCVGETCAILILLGGLYLIYKGIISYIMPLCYLATIFILSFLLGGFNIEFAMFQILAGGVMLGGFFMLTDYTTSPMTKKGQIIYAILAGVIATVIRLYGGYPEGCSYSILLANVATPLIDKFVNNRVFGEVSKSE